LRYNALLVIILLQIKSFLAFASGNLSIISSKNWCSDQSRIKG